MKHKVMRQVAKRAQPMTMPTSMPALAPLESWSADEGLFEFVGRGVPLALLVPCVIRLRDVAVAVPVAGRIDVMVCVPTAPACARRSSQSASSGVTGFCSISDLLRLQEELALLFDM